MHDARRPADILYHQYKVLLTNVYDTMVADAKIQGDANYGNSRLHYARERERVSE